MWKDGILNERVEKRVFLAPQTIDPLFQMLALRRSGLRHRGVDYVRRNLDATRADDDARHAIRHERPHRHVVIRIGERDVEHRIELLAHRREHEADAADARPQEMLVW